jgi:hypothetical protein
MKVHVMKQLLSDLPDDMEIMMEVGEALISVCRHSEVEEIPILNDGDIDADELTEEEFDSLEKIEVLVLKYCAPEQPEHGEINSQPELN